MIIRSKITHVIKHVSSNESLLVTNRMQPGCRMWERAAYSYLIAHGNTCSLLYTTCSVEQAESEMQLIDRLKVGAPRLCLARGNVWLQQCQRKDQIFFTQRKKRQRSWWESGCVLVQQVNTWMLTQGPTLIARTTFIQFHFNGELYEPNIN